MGYRVFTDSKGTEWQAWDVIPTLAERRADDRRVSAAGASDDQRRKADRRMLTGERPRLTAGLDRGWLCFEAPVEKRRLTPIPADWLRCPQQQLEDYCQRAKVAARARSLGALLGKERCHA